MNQNFYNNIVRLARRNNYKIVELKHGFLITAETNEEYNMMWNQLHRMKHIRLDYSNHYTHSVRIYHETDYIKMKESEDRKARIVNRFFEEMNLNGRDPEKAKAAQKIFAESIGGIAEFNMIYA